MLTDHHHVRVVTHRLKDDKELNSLLDVLKSDNLREYELEQQRQAEKCVVTSSKLIAPGRDALV